MKKFSAPFLRASLSLVFLWFGFNQIFDPLIWESYVPEFVLKFGFSAADLVLVNGVFEVVLGFALLLGIYVRFTALILGVHLFVIAASFGLSAVGVRDFGLALATLSVAMQGSDFLCLTNRKNL